MSHESFQPNNLEIAGPHGLNLCDIFEVGETLKNDLNTHGPGLLKSALTETKPETVVAAGASAVLITASVLAGSEALIGIGAACGLAAAGKVVTDTLLPKVSFKF